MSETRKTEIKDIELEDFEDETIRDEIFEKFKIALLDTDPTRLLGKFYNYCYEYVNFEFDESAHNMDEADDVLRKLNILRDKLIETLENSLGYSFFNVQTDTLEYKIIFNTKIDNITYNINLEVLADSFYLEIL